MAKISIDTKGFEKRIRELERLLDTNELKDEIGKIGVRYTVGQTRNEKDLERGGTQPSLAASTIERREYLANYNTTSASYRAARSNLTFTGQLLNAITFERIVGGVRLFFKDTKRKPYKGKRGTYKNAPTNAEVAEFLADQGRGAFGVDEGLAKQITSAVTRFIRRALRQS